LGRIDGIRVFFCRSLGRTPRPVEGRPVDTMPPALQMVARALPLTYVNEGLRATMVFGNESTAALYLLITVVVGIVLFIIPAKALSWKSK